MTLEQTIIDEANRCVKCGLCLPHCPTYKVSQNEAESPRGRIAIAAALAADQIPLTETLTQHLEQCLTCRACEAVCPSEVNYGKIIDHSKALLKQRNAPKVGKFVFMLNKFNLPWLRFYQASGLQAVVRKSGLLKLLGLVHQDALLPKLQAHQPWQDFYPAINSEQGRVALFLGCVTDQVDQETLTACITLLTTLGFGVYVPKAQSCCGALALHAGNTNEFQQLGQTNLSAFQQDDIQAIVSITTGCTSVLTEYDQTLTIKNAETFSKQVLDIHEFLLRIDWPTNVELKPLAQRATIHTPCSLRNILKQSDNVANLLAKIPDLECTPLISQDCCGAAGTNMQQFPELAQQLLDPIVTELRQHSVDLLVTSDIGCQLHLQSALPKLSIVHPLRLLAAQISLMNV